MFSVEAIYILARTATKLIQMAKHRRQRASDNFAVKSRKESNKVVPSEHSEWTQNDDIENVPQLKPLESSRPMVPRNKNIEEVVEMVFEKNG